MANTSSARKAARQAVRRTKVNTARRSRMKTEIRKVEEAIAAGNRDAALAALKTAEPVLARSAQKGLVHKHMASRKISRLTRRVQQMAT